MKEKILNLRKLGYSYKKIERELGCARSTISYHCRKNNLTPKSTIKIDDNLIKNIISDRNYLTIKEISKKYGISISSVKKHTSKKIEIHDDIICLNCGNKSKYETNKKFCSVGCSSNYLHKMAYKNFLDNNEKYCTGYYIPKGFKDFFLEEQNNKCAICGNEPYWMNKKIVFVIDHIDGDASNNKRENIRLICPNCDSQTDTFKSKTKNSKRRNYVKENIIKKYGGNLAG